MAVKIIAEWIPHMMAYRLYDPEKPENTIAYEDNLDEAINRGYMIVINGGSND